MPFDLLRLGARLQRLAYERVSLEGWFGEFEASTKMPLNGGQYEDLWWH